MSPGIDETDTHVLAGAAIRAANTDIKFIHTSLGIWIFKIKKNNSKVSDLLRMWLSKREVGARAL